MRSTSSDVPFQVAEMPVTAPEWSRIVNEVTSRPLVCDPSVIGMVLELA